MIYRDRLVNVPVPEPHKLDPLLTRDCPPSVTIKVSQDVRVFELMMRLSAVEDALSACREQLSVIRMLQPVLPAKP